MSAFYTNFSIMTPEILIFQFSLPFLLRVFLLYTDYSVGYTIGVLCRTSDLTRGNTPGTAMLPCCARAVYGPYYALCSSDTLIIPYSITVCRPGRIHVRNTLEYVRAGGV